jgi:hypothetical protein
MFDNIKRLWSDSGIGSCIEGIVREAKSGNVVEAQRWYRKLRMDCYAQARSEGVDPAVIEQRGLDNVGIAVAIEYRKVLEEACRPFGPFSEVDEYLRSNNLI